MSLPAVEEFRPGIWSVPLPLPASPLAYVCTYALETRDGVVLVDAGWDTDEALSALGEGLAHAGASLADVRGVLVTHIHPDHYGLAGRVREESGAWVALHPADAALVADRYEDVDDLLDATAGWLRQAGAPESELEELRDASLNIRDLVVSASPDVLLRDGERPDVPGRQVVALHTPGHTPGHLCFHALDDGVLFTGDHVLPRITPHVGYHPQSDPDPLGDFLDSLERVRGHGDLAAPGHEYRFTDIDARLNELREHHRERLGDVAAILDGGAETVWEVAAVYPWSRGWERLSGFMLRAALAEVHAHLVRLECAGRAHSSAGTLQRWQPAAETV